MSIHVLFLMEDLCYGGTQRQTLQLAARLSKERFRVTMLTLTGPTDLDAEAEQHGIGLVHIGTTRRVDSLFFMRLPFWLSRLHPDVLVPCTALPNIWGRIWGRCLSIPVVGTVRGGGAPVRQHERFLWKLADHIVCNSEALYEIMAGFGVGKEHLSYIPNGVNTDFFMPSEQKPSQRVPRISCLARLAGDKDHETLISAFERVCEQRPDARLRLIGDGPLEAKIQERVQASPYASAIELVSGTPDVRKYYAESRIVALSSLREGQPNVLMEAMAAGLPICATAVGGIPKLVKDGRNGLLSPARDVAAFAASLLSLLEDPEECDAMGQRNREDALQRFSFAPMVAAHEAIFMALAQK